VGKTDFSQFIPSGTISIMHRNFDALDLGSTPPDATAQPRDVQISTRTRSWPGHPTGGPVGALYALRPGVGNAAGTATVDTTVRSSSASAAESGSRRSRLAQHAPKTTESSRSGKTTKGLVERSRSHHGGLCYPVLPVDDRSHSGMAACSRSQSTCSRC
jgi:hypothetical protein